MILSSDAVKIRERLVAIGKFPVESRELTSGFQSGKQMMDALRELSAAGLVRMEGELIWLQQNNTVASDTWTTWKPRLVNFWTVIIAIIGFGWLLFAQVLSAEKTCSVLPDWAAEWLDRCEEFDGSESG